MSQHFLFQFSTKSVEYGFSLWTYIRTISNTEIMLPDNTASNSKWTASHVDDEVTELGHHAILLQENKPTEANLPVNFMILNMQSSRSTAALSKLNTNVSL